MKPIQSRWVVAAAVVDWAVDSAEALAVEQARAGILERRMGSREVAATMVVAAMVTEVAVAVGVLVVLMVASMVVAAAEMVTAAAVATEVAAVRIGPCSVCLNVTRGHQRRSE